MWILVFLYFLGSSPRCEVLEKKSFQCCYMLGLLLLLWKYFAISSQSLSLWKLKTSFMKVKNICHNLWWNISYFIYLNCKSLYVSRMNWDGTIFFKKQGFVAIYWPEASFMSHERHLYKWTIVNVNKKLCSGPGILACSFLLILEHKFSLLNWKLVLLLKVTPVVFHFKYFWW